MTPERLKELIEAGESLDVEFKGEKARPINDNELVEAVVCLANRPSGNTGWLLIGVEDNKQVTGARPRHPGGKTDLTQVQALVANRTRPSLACRALLIKHGRKSVLAIEVPVSRAPVGTSDGKYIRRALGGKGKPICLPFHFHEMQALQAHRGTLDYSRLPVAEASWEDLDPLEFERYRRHIRESRGQGDSSLLSLPDLELAKALGAVEANHKIKEIRILGLLLFGKKEALRKFIPTHEFAFQALEGVEVKVNEFFHLPLLRTMDEIITRFFARNSEKELMVGLLRVGVPDYPEKAFREGLANSLIHRDYTQQGAVHM